MSKEINEARHALQEAVSQLWKAIEAEKGSHTANYVVEEISFLLGDLISSVTVGTPDPKGLARQALEDSINIAGTRVLANLGSEPGEKVVIKAVDLKSVLMH